MLAREFRIAADKDIKRVLKLGKRLGCSECTLYFVPNSVGRPRVCVVVAGGVSKEAVVRNRVKRQCRDILRRGIQSRVIKQEVDMVVMIRPPVIKILDKERSAFFRSFFERIGILPRVRA